MLDEELVLVGHVQLEYGLDDQPIGVLFLARVLISWLPSRQLSLLSMLLAGPSWELTL